MSTALTAIPVTQLSTTSVSRALIAQALYTLRNEAEARLLALEAGAADWKASVLAASIAALPANTRTANVLTADANGAFPTVDGETIPVGGRFLAQNEGGGASHINNGVYTLTSAGGGAAKWVATRATDFDETSEITSMAVIPVEAGTIHGGTARQVRTTGAITVNVTALEFGLFATGSAYHLPVADSTALAAIPAVARANGMTCVKLDDDTSWVFDSGSAAAASDWVTVPAAGSGRWFRKDALVGAVHAPVADAAALQAIAATGRVDGMSCIKLDDYTLWRFAGASAAAADTWHIVPAAGAGRWVRVDETQGMLHAAVADAAAIAAIAATDRIDGMQVVRLDDVTVWTFDAGSAAGADDFCIVPGAGTGRWLRQSIPQGLILFPVADNAALLALTAVQRRDGSLVEKLDDNSVWVYDLGSVLAGVTNWTIEPTDGVGCWFRIDAPRGAILPPVADNAALIALTAANRIDGSVVVQLDTMQTWKYDLGSAAAASDWCVLPTDGVGRWLDVANPSGGLILPSVADNAALIALTAVDRQDGSLVVQLDTMQVWKYDLGSAAAASDWVVLPTDGVGRWLDVGYPNGGLMLPPVADDAALVALTAVDRQDGSVVIKLDDLEMWRYDLGSAAGASDWVQVPTDAVGRWLRTDVSLVDLAGTTATTGGELVGQYDPNGVIAATTVGAATREIATDLNSQRPGSPMFNRIIMLGAPGAIVEGNTVVIDSDTYEFRASTPPAGGTAGRIWVYQGLDSAASRANFINAVNGVVDAATITRTLEDPVAGTNTELVAAAAGTTLGTVDVYSAVAIGGAEAPSALALATTETLATVTDIWDAANMYAGKAQTHGGFCSAAITITAAMITAGFVEFECLFTPTSVAVFNRSRPQDELVTIAGDRVVLALAGGVTPNNQPGDVVDFWAMA